jgi:hypothetical protein
VAKVIASRPSRGEESELSAEQQTAP